MLRRLGWRGLVVGVAIGLLAGGTFAWAAIPDSTTGSITACYPTSGTAKGALRVIDYQTGARCASGEALLTWSSRGVRWRGPWVGTVAYVVNDVVRYSGSAYIAKLANTNVAPTNTTNWALMVSAGATGPTGVSGSQGPTGSTGAPGPSQPITLVTGNQQIGTTSTIFANIPGVTAAVNVDADNTKLLIEFSGVLGCASGTAPNDGDGCMARILVDGQATDPGLGPEGFMMSRELPDYWSGGGYTERASAVVNEGAHTVQVQWAVQDVPPLTDGTQWYLNYWTLSVQRATS